MMPAGYGARAPSTQRPVNLRDENGTIVARGRVNYDSDGETGLRGRSTRLLASKLGTEYERERSYIGKTS